MVTKQGHGLSEHPEAREGDLVLLVHESVRFAQLFKIRSLLGGDSFRALWGYNLDFRDEDQALPSLRLPYTEKIPVDNIRDSTADYVYVGSREEIIRGLREHDRFRPYGSFLENIRVK